MGERRGEGRRRGFEVNGDAIGPPFFFFLARFPGKMSRRDEGKGGSCEMYKQTNQ